MANGDNYVQYPYGGATQSPRTNYVKYDPEVEKQARKTDALTTAGKWAGVGASVGSVIPGIGTAIGGVVGGVAGLGYSLIHGGDVAAAEASKHEKNKVKMENQLISGVNQAENISGINQDPWAVTGTRSSRMAPISGPPIPPNMPAKEYDAMLRNQELSGVNTLG